MSQGYLAFCFRDWGGVDSFGEILSRGLLGNLHDSPQFTLCWYLAHCTHISKYSRGQREEGSQGHL